MWTYKNILPYLQLKIVSLNHINSMMSLLAIPKTVSLCWHVVVGLWWSFTLIASVTRQINLVVGTKNSSLCGCWQLWNFSHSCFSLALVLCMCLSVDKYRCKQSPRPTLLFRKALLPSQPSADRLLSTCLSSGMLRYVMRVGMWNAFLVPVFRMFCN